MSVSKTVAIQILIALHSYAEMADAICEAADEETRARMGEEVALWCDFAQAIAALWREWIARFGISQDEYERELKRADRFAED